MTSSKRSYATTPHLPGLLLSVPLSPQQATADPCLQRRPSNTHRQVWFNFLWGSPLLSLDPAVRKVLFVPPRVLQVWGLILTGLYPSYNLISASPLSLDMECLFFSGFQHPLVNGCSTASCNFGALSRGDEHTFFHHLEPTLPVSLNAVSAFN